MRFIFTLTDERPADGRSAGQAGVMPLSMLRTSLSGVVEAQDYQAAHAQLRTFGAALGIDKPQVVLSKPCRVCGLESSAHQTPPNLLGHPYVAQLS